MNKRISLKIATYILMISSLLFNGCSQAAGTTAASSAGTTTASEVTTTTTYNLADYNFTWTDELSDKFSNHCKSVFKRNLAGYVISFGFTEELNEEFTKFVNSNFGTNYDKVPFEKANYFYSHIYPESDHYLYRDYNRFSAKFLNGQKFLWGTFKNKSVMSYLIANNIELGKMVPLENLKSIFGDKVNSKSYLNFCLTNPQIGNYDSSYKYTDEEMFAILLYYNVNLSELFNDERVKTRDFNDIPDPEAIKIYNQHLRKFYGENAPQIGQVPTKEQYRSIFGEDPLDLSYIPGAVVNSNG